MLEGLVAGLLNRFIGPYVTNLNVNQLNIAIWSGDVKLTNLQLKKDALDKFSLPVDVIEGYLGELTLSIPWSNLKNKPVKVYINNVYLLCVPKGESEYDPEEEAARAQALKEDRLANAELLSTKPTSGMDDEEKKNATFLNQLITKVVDNLQVSINNIHVRYEDKLSDPKHPFSAGLTLSQLSAVSTDIDWNPTFIHDEANTIHKLATLDSLAMYWNTDSRSLAGRGVDEAQKLFSDLIAKADHVPSEHQYVLKPVSGSGKIKLNKRYGGSVPKAGATLNFEELGFVVDDEQYRDALLMMGLFQSFMRQHEFRKHRPPKAITPKKNPLAWFRYAGNAVLEQIHERNRKWTWSYFEERRDDRKAYVELYKNKKLGRNDLEDEEKLKKLEWKLSYEDIRLYRSIAKGAMRREKILIEKKHVAEQPKGWISSWWYGAGTTEAAAEEEDATSLTDAQKQQLYDVIDYDEKTALQSSLEEAKDTILLSIRTKLKTGSFALKKDPHGKNHDIFSIVFDTFLANIIQRTDNFRAGIALGGLTCVDGTTENTLYPKIVRVKDSESSHDLMKRVAEGETVYGGEESWRDSEDVESLSFDPFFSVDFEHNPLDGHADNVLEVKMRHLEIIYNPTTVDTVLAFLKPPPSEADGLNALLEAAGDTLEGLAAQTRAGLEYALEEHKRLDLRVDMDAPVIVLPESCTDINALVAVLDVGHIFVESNLVSKEDLAVVESNHRKSLDATDFEKLQDLMYDRFVVQLSSTQLLVGQSVERCLEQIRSPAKNSDLHVIDRINMTFHVHLSILPKAVNLTKIRVFGDLPLLQVNFSDRKYKTLMRIVDLVVPKDSAPAPDAPAAPTKSTKSIASKPNTLMRYKDDLILGDMSDSDQDDEDGHHKHRAGGQSIQAGKQQEAELTQAQLFQKTFQFSFKVQKFAVTLKKSGSDINQPDRTLADLIVENFGLKLTVRPVDMSVKIVLGSLYVEDKIDTGSLYPYLISSDADGKSTGTGGDLINVSYIKVNKISPEYESKYNGVDATVDISFSTVTMIVTRKSVLALFDFILTTFTAGPQPARPPPTPLANSGSQSGLLRIDTSQPVTPPVSQDKMKVKVSMTSINFILNNDGQRLATMALSQCDVSVMMAPPTMLVNVKLGNFTLTDDINPGKRQLLAIQGEELADFAYETYDPNSSNFPGYDASIYLRAGSLQLTFLEEPIRQLLDFSTKFAKMHVLYDAARNAAVNQAQVIQTTANKMHFDIQISTPIVILPKDASSKNVIIANLGEISIFNDFVADQEAEGNTIDQIKLGIRSINLQSEFHFKDFVQKLQIIENVDIGFEIIRSTHVPGSQRPDMELVGHMSDVSMNLTELQYKTLYGLSQSFGRAFSGNGEVDTDAMAIAAGITSVPPTPAPVLPLSTEKWTSIDLVFILPRVTLEIYQGDATQNQELRDSSFSKFSLSKTDFKYKMLTDSTMQLELTIQDLIINDTRRNVKSKFREVIPANLHDSPQISLSLNTWEDKNMLAIVNVDSPKVIFHLEYIFALQNYFMSVLAQPPAEVPSASASSPQNIRTKSGNIKRQAIVLPPVTTPSKPAEPGPTLHYRVSVIAPEIILLANASSASTDAIILCAHQVVVSQQETMTLIVDRVGMFLCKMDKREDTTVRFIDNFDIALSLGTRSPIPGHQLTNITLDVRPLVLRLSYRDAMLVMNIVNKVTEMQSKTAPAVPEVQSPNATHIAKGESSTMKPNVNNASSSRSIASAGTAPKPNAKKLVEEASFVSTRETLKGSIQGLQLILIDDLHSLPMLDLKLDRFDVEVKEWSSELKVDTSIRPSINYFNVRNSHWEPLLEPWQVVVHAARVVQPPSMSVDIFSRQDLNINISHTFIETALHVMSAIQKEPEQPLAVNREALVPYILKNKTGYALHVWAESENNVDIVIHKLKDGDSLPWRFDDWRKMRETVSSKKNTLGIQFDGVPWESLKDIPVEREGRSLHVLRPKLNKVSHRVVVDIQIKNNVKVVTFSSALQVENATSVPVEVVVVDDKRQFLSSSQKIAPGEKYCVPIEAAYKHQLLVRPDPGFKYNWSVDPIYWRELATHQKQQQRYSPDGQTVNSVSCRPLEEGAQPFRFQLRGDTDNFDPILKDYPYMSIRLSAPVEIENLLPYNMKFTVMEKTSPKHSGPILTSYLRKGGISPLHTVDVRNLMLLSVFLENTNLSPSEYAIVSSHDPDELPVENTLTLMDPDGLKLTLGIHRVVIPGSGGAVKFSVFSPYVILNKTGLDLVFKAKSFMQNAKIAAGQSALRPGQNTAQPLMFSYGKTETGNRTVLQIGNDSQWSRPVSFEAVGSIMEIAVPALERQEEIHLGMNVEVGKGKYSLSKVVTISPRFILKNNMGEDLHFREYGSSTSTILPQGSRVPLRYMRLGQQKLLSLRLPGVTSRWTAPFNIEEMGKVYVRIVRSDGETGLVRVFVMMEVATIFVILSKEEGRWPYRIDNKSSWDIKFTQQNAQRGDAASLASSASLSITSAKTYELKAGDTIPYSWDLPHVKDKTLVLTVNDREREVSLQEIGALVPFKFPAGDTSSIISIDVIAEGPTQVLVLADYDSTQSVFRQRSSSQLTLQERGGGDERSTGKDSAKEGFEVIDMDSVITFSFQIRLECIGISVLNQRMQELIYMSMTGLEMRYTDSNMYQSINMLVKWLQIDNQLYGGDNPIILCPTHSPKDGKDAQVHPTLHGALVRAKDDTHGVVYFKYFSALVQELSFTMDEDFLFTLLEFSKFNVPGWVEDPTKVQLCDESLDLPEPTATDGDNQLFFEVLHLHPMKLNISFTRSDHVNIEEAQQKTSSQNPIMYIFNVLTMAIGNIDSAPITLNALLLENVRASGPVLMDLLQRHYSQDFFYQLHLLVGSIEFLGNPVGLFNNLSSGVADFFYEPYQGFIMGDRPQDIGMGIARGTSSLLKKTVFGFSDSLAKISGSVGKGLSAATMDKSFQERRRMNGQRNVPKHALSGLSQGATSFAQGLVSGVTGIVEQPLNGAQKGGVEGFFKGVGKGLVGVVTKPLVGVFDLTTNITAGIRNTTTVFDKDQRRKRIPRHVPMNGILTQYDRSEAVGQMWLKQVNNGRFFYDDYIAHLVLKGDTMVAMLSSKRIMVFRTENLKAEWELEYSDIQSVAPFPRGISITSRRDRQENFIPIFEQGALQWFSGKIEEKINSFNAELRPLE